MFRMNATFALSAGFATADISPAADATLYGYGFRAPGFDRIHAPLLARVCAIHDGTQPAALVALDHCVIPDEQATALRAEIATALGTSIERVMLAATHTHSGPEPTPAYFAAIRDRTVDAARRAAGYRVPVVARFREAPLGLAYNRRVPRGDGGNVHHCWGTQEWPDRIPVGTPDPTCSVLELAQLNGDRRYLIWNLGAHPVALGKTSRVLSPDYPGVANAVIESVLPGSHALFTLGAAGDAQPWISTEELLEGADLVGRTAGLFVSVLRHGAPPLAAGSASGDAALRCVARTVVIAGAALPLMAWRLGPLYFVGLPVELVAELGIALRRRLPGPVFVITVANGWHGYWCTARQWAEGGYEIEVARTCGLTPGCGEALVDAASALARELD